MSEKTISVLIVDDEPLARGLVRNLLESQKDIRILGECSGGMEAVESIRGLRPDLVFLDIQMPECDGFQVLQQIPIDGMPVIIFVTAYDEHALKAFEVHALDYLLKPFDDDRFQAALGRARQEVRRDGLDRLNQRLLDLVESTARGGDRHSKHLERIMVRAVGRITFLRVDEIRWIEAADYYVRLHGSTTPIMHRESLNRLEGRLDPSRLFRAHRSSLVNLDHVREIHTESNSHLVVLSDGTSLRLSRGRRKELEDRLAGRQNRS